MAKGKRISLRSNIPGTKNVQLIYLLMCLPGLLWLVFFQLFPMSGIVMAFQDFRPKKGMWGSSFVGLENFEYLFSLSEVWRVSANTLIIALSKIVLNLLVPLTFALMINQLKNLRYKKLVQTVTYLPHFISWVILGNIMGSIFAYDGIFNSLRVLFGHEAQVWMGNADFFRGLIIYSDIWKETGFGAIIFLAAISGVSPELYEAASLDGANGFQQLRHVTLPGISSTIILVMVLSLGGILNAGFEQIFSMYNTMVMSTSDIIDTWVYRMGLIKMDFSISTAAGLIKSLIGMVFILVSYVFAYKYADYKIF